MDLDRLVLVDQHCHAIRLDELDLAAFEALCSESPTTAGNGSHLDGPVGFAIGRWCPPVIDLEPFCSWESYVARRSQLGAVEVARRMLTGANQSALLIDTGYRGDELCSLTEMGALAGAPTREIVRIELVAEEVAASGVRVTDFMDAFEARLLERCDGAIGLKSVLAYRCGFFVDLLAADDDALDGAIGHWLSHGGRLADATIEGALLRLAARIGGRLGLPIQFHVGYGDPDVVLHRSNPSLLTPFIEWCAPLGTQIVLLHCWPYEREAGFLATVYPHVWMDIGLAMNYLGPSAPDFLGRALEATPHPKVLYSTDAFGLAELYLAGAAQFRWALGRVLDGWVGRGSMTASAAETIGDAIGTANATTLYRL